MTVGPALFLDRDGVLVRDVGYVTEFEKLEPLPGIAKQLGSFRRAGFRLFIVTNQPVIARGLMTELQLQELHHKLQAHWLSEDQDALIEAFLYCPHHPNANVLEFRMNCSCRKPRPGMLERARDDFDVELHQSFMVGDRLTDMAAGFLAGCRGNILIESGRHLDPPIETDLDLDLSRVPIHLRLGSLTEMDPKNPWFRETSRPGIEPRTPTR